MPDWGSIIGGVLAAGTTIYAANQQKKMQQEQYKQQQNLYNEQIQYQQDQIAAARSTPMAQLAPILMESLINAYSGKLSKFGINLPVEEMLGAIGRGRPSGGAMSAMLGGGLQATMSPEQAYGMGGFKGYRKAEQTDFMDAQIEQARQALNGFSDGTGRMIKNPWVGDTSIQDSIWNQEVGQGALALGGGGGGAPQGKAVYDDNGNLTGYVDIGARGGSYIPGQGVASWLYDKLPLSLQNAMLGYAAMDENSKILGNAGQFGIRTALGQLPGLGQLANLGLSAVDRNPYSMLTVYKGDVSSVPDPFAGYLYAIGGNY